MSKIKLPSVPPRIDMTPMVDLFFLLLTFFMLTTSFKPQEAKPIDTPQSVSEKLTPEKNVITVLISKDDKVFFNIDNGGDSTMHVRRKVLTEISKYFRIPFTPEQIKKFEGLASFGMPIKNLGAWIDSSDPKERDAMQVGMPIDSLDNQLERWVLFARNINPIADAAIKGDGEADYKVVKRVLDIMQTININRFNLTTTLNKVEVKIQK